MLESFCPHIIMDGVQRQGLQTPSHKLRSSEISAPAVICQVTKNLSIFNFSVGPTVAWPSNILWCRLIWTWYKQITRKVPNKLTDFPTCHVSSRCPNQLVTFHIPQLYCPYMTAWNFVWTFHIPFSFTLSSITKKRFCVKLTFTSLLQKEV